MKRYAYMHTHNRIHTFDHLFLLEPFSVEYGVGLKCVTSFPAFLIMELLVWKLLLGKFEIAIHLT